MEAKMRDKRTRKRRLPLNRERVLRAAVGLADRGGVESLSMRKLAKDLGVEAMSLYNHIANKEDMLDGMVDIVFGEIDFPVADWRAGMRQRAISTREALSRHRWAVGLMESRSNPGPEGLRVRNAVLECLRKAGFSLELTVLAYSAQDSYIYGFALQEKTIGFETEGSAAAAQRSVQGYEAVLTQYPYLAEVVAGHVAKVGYDFDEAFVFGLDLILDGLDRLRNEPPP
jgi:AcrR family transcriptional regulator